MNDKPHGAIQWKSTDVCMDCYCECGASFHVDGYQGYNVKCPKCGAIYECNPRIEFTRVESAPDWKTLVGLPDAEDGDDRPATERSA